MIASTATFKFESLQKMFSQLQDEILMKNDALKKASYQIVTMQNEKEGLSGSIGVGTVDQLKSDMRGLREKIACLEEEKRK